MRQSNLFIAVIVLLSTALLGFFGVAALTSPDETADDATMQGRIMVPLKRPTLTYGNPSVGPENAPVTIFSFGDYQCVPCTEMNAALVQLRAEFPTQVRVVWKDMPDAALHSAAVPAANAARCAGDQGQFWQYHALLMSQGGTLVEANFPIFAAQLGLDTTAFKTCVDSERNVPIVERDVTEGLRLKISATPTVFIGDQRVVGSAGVDELRTYVQQALNTSK